MTETPLTPLQRNAECRRLAEKFREVLYDAASRRAERDDIVQAADGPEMGWALYERDQMRAAVNAEREARGLPPATAGDILRVERPGRGHSDYAAQFAWACAQLVMYPETPAPGAAGQQED